MGEVFTLRDAKARLSELLDRVAAGDEIEIVRRGSRGGRFRILAIETSGAARRPGRLKNRIALPLNFDDDDPEIIADFEGIR